MQRTHLYQAIAASALLVSIQSQAASDLYFSEYIEGSSYNKALEIANTTGAPVDLSGYTIRFYSNGKTTTSLDVDLTGTVADGDVFVFAAYRASAEILAEADQVSGSSFFNGDDAITLSKGDVVVDSIGQIGFDPGSQWGSGETSTANNTIRRLSSVDGGDTNPNDTFDPSIEWEGFPQNTFDGLGSHGGNGGGGGDNEPPATACGDAVTPLHTIQGNGSESPIKGDTVSVEAVLIGDFRGSGALRGFFLQEEDADQDADPSTSEGVFVYEGSTVGIDLAVGDLVHLTAKVAEYSGQTQLSDISNLQVCASGLSVTPTAVELPSEEGAFENVEGMSVSFWQDLSVTETFSLGRYGELGLSSGGRLMNPTQVAMPGEEASALGEANDRRRITLDDGRSSQNQDAPYPAPGLSADNVVRIGDTVSSLSGIMAEGFGSYRIQPTSDPVIVPTNPRSAEPALPGEGSLKVASFNVLNYFNGASGFPSARGADSADEFDRQRAKIISALVAMDADIVGLVEIENNGFGEDSAIQDLVNGLSDAGLEYNFVDPGLESIGTDAIAVGFIYKAETVSLKGDVAILDSSVDPDFIDTKNRPALAQTFSEIASGGSLTISVNHLKSKGSNCNSLEDPNTGDGQGNCNLTRTKAAQALANWLETDPTGQGNENTLIIGDLNAYAMEDPIRAIEEAGYTNLAKTLGDDHAYSYVFSGESGNLDHALSSANLAIQVSGLSEWHINADEPVILDYNEEFKSAAQVVNYYSPGPYRASDHDPLIIELALSGPGDYNHDGIVNKADFKLLQAQLNTYVSMSTRKFDLNDDGRITGLDVAAWKEIWKQEGRAK